MNPSVQNDDARFLDLLRRWQSGDFTRSDEHELKALTDSDDFRREAMEGFMSLPDADHDSNLLALRKKVRLRSAPQPDTVVIFRIGAAAAVLALLIAAIWVFPRWSADKTAPIASNQPESAGTAVAPRPVPRSEETESNRVADVPTAPPAVTPVPERSSSAPGNQNKSIAGTAPVPADKVADNQIETEKPPVAVTPAPASTNPASIPVLEDKAAGSFSATEQDEVQAAEAIATKDLSNAKKAPSKARKNDSVWHKTDVKPDMEAEKKEAREAMQPQISEPSGGWDAFNEYLRQNARLTPEARNNNISGTVRLQFSVNGNGEPQNFITLRSLGYGCDEEAVRLIKNWDWVPGKIPLVTVEVRFVR